MKTDSEIEKEEIIKRYETFVKANTTPVFLKENVFKCMDEYAKWYSEQQTPTEAKQKPDTKALHIGSNGIWT